VTHHIASIFWAIFYERWFGRAKDRGDVVTALAGGTAVSAVACFVDYRLTPRRLQPGYEMRLSRPSLAVVYLSFGIGLAIGVLFKRRDDATSWDTGDPTPR
jgi:RsiW-degrading membrane proteinase PrsW (M82 family)